MCNSVTGSALLVTGYIPVALRKSEGAGSVRALVRLPGAHLYTQVLGNTQLKRFGGPVTPVPRKRNETSMFCGLNRVQCCAQPLRWWADFSTGSFTGL